MNIGLTRHYDDSRVFLPGATSSKKNIWEGIILLPFIEQEKLLTEVKNCRSETNYSVEESIRNCFAKDIIFYSTFKKNSN